TANTADEPVNGIFVVESAAELNPGGRNEKGGQAAAFTAFSARKQYGDNTKETLAFAHSPVDSGAHLLILPGASATGTDEDGAGRTIIQRRFDRFLPGRARDQVPHI